MIIDKYGQHIASEIDIFCHIMSNSQFTTNHILVDQRLVIDPYLEIENIPEFRVYEPPQCSVEEYDRLNQENWYMPPEYKNLDIAEWVLSRCGSDAEAQRAADELLLYSERNLFDLLRYMVYLVDVMRTNGIVWGVGRGSSIASFVLYIIGVHRINSLVYDLDISEFLK